MDAHSRSHPTPDILSSYALGKLDDPSAQAVDEHLEQCADCRTRVAEITADSFLGGIRDARQAASHAMSEPTQPDATKSGDGTSGPAPSAGKQLPAGLADHPDYEIKRELGRGGMGVVYLAHNRLMARDEVLKVMGQQIVEEPGVVDRFLREIRAVARLRHPNIVRAYTAFRSGESLVFAMEYVAGLDLARIVKAKGPLPIGNACNYVRQAALGLQHAHEEGMVHRDIKPGNLMLSYKGDRAVIKVLDFGLAKASREQQLGEPQQDEPTESVDWVGSLTRTGQMLGTPDFIAPEQIVDAQRADIRADIYSLGCTLYSLLSGRAPFEARRHQDVLKGHRSMDARLLNIVRPDVPAELAAVVTRMMAKEPDLRFQEPNEVAEALSPFFKKPSVKRATMEPESPRATATGAGLGSAEMIPTAANAAPDLENDERHANSIWARLIDFTDAPDDVADVPSEVESVRNSIWGRLIDFTDAPGDVADVPAEVESVSNSIWGRLIDFTDAPDELADVPAEVESVRNGGRWYRRVLVSAIGFAAIAMATAFAYRTVTNKSDVLIETDDPGIKFVVRLGGRLVKIVDLRTTNHVELSAGRYELALAGDKPGLWLSTESLTVRRGEKYVVRAHRETRRLTAGPKGGP